MSYDAIVILFLRSLFKTLSDRYLSLFQIKNINNSESSSLCYCTHLLVFSAQILFFYKIKVKIKTLNCFFNDRVLHTEKNYTDIFNILINMIGIFFINKYCFILEKKTYFSVYQRTLSVCKSNILVKLEMLN